MKTSLDTVDIIYQALSGSSVKTAITGRIAKYQRLLNSVKEDIVINSLPITNGQIQNAVVNVNIHVPNKKVGADGVQDSSQPDSARLKELSNQVINVLDNSWGAGYNYSIQQQNIIQDNNDYYSNIRVQFVWVNVN